MASRAAQITVPIPSRTEIPTFARHESFHPRFGWLKKGYDKAQEDSEVFLREDAALILGVGKNMVRAIRYWCSAFKVTEEISENRLRKSQPSEFGKLLLSENGWDPFLESEGALWLLHWNLLKSPSIATTWQYLFGNVRQTEFTAEELTSQLSEYIQTTYPSATVAESSLKSDIACALRMYAVSKLQSRVTEETIVSPFVNLGLIDSLPDSKHFAFRIGAKQNLHAEIITAACLEYAHQTRPGQRSINMSQLLFDHLSPGQCFKLTESALYSALEHMTTKNSNLILSDTAGIVQLQFTVEPNSLSEKILAKYFETQRGAN
ncbi:MAG: DUF4007 family protein [Candidatus Obscuribacter sp.]|nr:DUF4007 family protein [Candidatus Obscuribacter sp.]